MFKSVVGTEMTAPDAGQVLGMNKSHREAIQNEKAANDPHSVYHY
jgi:hypothetical protein